MWDISDKPVSWSELGKNFMREIERMALLKTIDNHWVEHIDAMEQLEEGIGLRGIGQQNPADAYAQEGIEMFEEMINDIKKETISICYNAGLRH